MRNFDYYNPVKILFGKGKIAEIAKWIPTVVEASRKTVSTNK